jgi:hypothetical protein
MQDQNPSFSPRQNMLILNFKISVHTLKSRVLFDRFLKAFSGSLIENVISKKTVLLFSIIIGGFIAQ